MSRQHNHHCRPAIMMIVDGLGDLPIAALGGRTPLEAAFTPNLDRLASAGLYGQIDPLAPGVVPNTDSGTGMLLGMSPDQAGSVKRGPIEAAGAGRVLGADEIALRANFATVTSSERGLLVTDRRAGRLGEGLDQLVRDLNRIEPAAGVDAEFISTDQHRGVLILSGKGLDPAITDTDPGDEMLPAPVTTSLPLHPGARLAADSLNRYVQVAHQCLHDHPVNLRRRQSGQLEANAIITRGAGSSFGIDTVITRGGLDAALVSGCNTVGGLARIFGFDWLHRPAFTAGADTDVAGKVEAAIDALERHDLAFIHVKAPDIFAHDLQPTRKRDFIEFIDEALAPLLGRDIVFALAADHTTDSNTGFHTADPVPGLIYDPRIAIRQSPVKFGEEACRSGTMERQSGESFVQRFLATAQA